MIRLYTPHISSACSQWGFTSQTFSGLPLTGYLQLFLLHDSDVLFKSCNTSWGRKFVFSWSDWYTWNGWYLVLLTTILWIEISKNLCYMFLFNSFLGPIYLLNLSKLILYLHTIHSFPTSFGRASLNHQEPGVVSALFDQRSLERLCDLPQASRGRYGDPGVWVWVQLVQLFKVWLL